MLWLEETIKGIWNELKEIKELLKLILVEVQHRGKLK
jgi:molybdenum-dependent DNA-binding transcriptional regulator ModE